MILKTTDSDLPVQYEPAGQTFVTNRVGDPSAAERDLGFTWSVELEDGFKRLVEWWRSHIEQVEKSRRKVKGER